MRAALIKLMVLQLRGWLRRQVSGGSTRRRVFMILGAGAFILWLSSAFFSAAMQKSMAPADILATMPFFLTLFAVLPIVAGGADRAIAFTPAEVDFLFPGPFSRRDLVLYKLVKLVLGSLMGGLIFSIWLSRFSASIPGSIVGATLTLVFVNMLTTAIALIRDAIHERTFAFVRHAATILLVGGIIAAVLVFSKMETGTLDRLKEILNGPVGHVVTTPARVFAHVFASQSISEGAAWAAACLGLIAAMAVLVLLFDKGYMEAALTASQRRQNKIARMGKFAPARAPGKPVRAVRLPAFSILGPAGAVFRRQLITAVRTSKAWIITFLFAFGYGYFMSRMMGGNQHIPAAAGLAPGLAIILMMLPQMIRFDFRGDLDHLDYLKSLPMSATLVTLGELAAPVMILSIMGWLIAGGVAVFMDFSPGILAMAALGVLPVGVLIIGLENFVFLLMPTRLFAPGQASMIFSGRRIVLMLLRLALLVVSGVVISAAGFGVWAIWHSTAPTFIACWLAACAIAAGVVRAVAWAFAKFDVSLDMPA